MSANWDHDKGGRDAWIAWLTEVLAEALRVARPGAHAFVWALPRTSGWTHRALEDAGWEVRDCCVHIFGQGFPKSLDVGKALDRAAGAEREVIGDRVRLGDTRAYRCNSNSAVYGQDNDHLNDGFRPPITAPVTDLAREWQGWGSALKPAAEFWYLARKPLAEKSIAANVARYGTGGLNIAGCRIEVDSDEPNHRGERGLGRSRGGRYGGGATYSADRDDAVTEYSQHAGRWPANVCLDEDAAAMLDAQSGERTTHGGGKFSNVSGSGNIYGEYARKPADQRFNGDTGGASRFFLNISRDGEASANTRHTDEGATNFAPLPGQRREPADSVSRFFYCGKSSRAERNAGLGGPVGVHANMHPT